MFPRNIVKLSQRSFSTSTKKLWSESPAIHVDPKLCMVDDKVNITIEGLEPSKIVTVHASTRVNVHCAYDSFAQYKSSHLGIVKTHEETSLRGSFIGHEPMGLFWAMQLNAIDEKNIASFPQGAVSDPVLYNLHVYDRRIDDINRLRELSATKAVERVASSEMRRTFVAPGVKRTEVQYKDLIATLFVPPGEGPFPAVITLFGGVPGLREYKSALLASHGFASLTLAYYGVGHLPKNFTDTHDLSYFENAIEFLMNHPSVYKSPGIGIVALCKGAQIALAMASELKNIRCVVWINGGISAIMGSLKYGDRTWAEAETKPYNFSHTQPNALADVFALPKPGGFTTLPGFFAFHEKHDVAYQFIIGEDDKCVPAAFLGNEIEDLLRSEGHPDYEIIRYPGAGHLLSMPYTPFANVFYQKPFNVFLNFGGEIVAHSKAEEDSWRRQLRFLKEKLI